MRQLELAQMAQHAGQRAGVVQRVVRPAHRDAELVRQVLELRALFHQRARQRQRVEEDQAVRPRQPGGETEQHRHIESAPVVRDQQIGSDELAELRPDLRERGLLAEVAVVVAVHLARPGADRPVGPDQPLELLDDHPAPDPYRRDLHDAALGGVHVRRLEIEGDVVLEGIGQIAAVVELQRLEEGERAHASRAEHEVPAGRPALGRERLHVVAQRGLQHPEQRNLDAAVRLDPDHAAASDRLVQPRRPSARRRESPSGRTTRRRAPRAGSDRARSAGRAARPPAVAACRASAAAPRGCRSGR